MSKPRQYREAAERKRDPHAYEALQPKPSRQPFDLDEERPWPLPEQAQTSADQPTSKGARHA